MNNFRYDLLHVQINFTNYSVKLASQKKCAILKLESRDIMKINKKIIQKIKNNVPGFIIGILTCSVVGVAAATFSHQTM